MSKDYIDKCSVVDGEVNGWLRITAEVQEKVCFKFGYKDELRNILAVNYLRRAQYIYPDDPRFKETQVYVRNNDAYSLEKCLNLGDILPNIDIFNINKKPTTIYDVMDKERYNLIIGSSET